MVEVNRHRGTCDTGQTLARASKGKITEVNARFTTKWKNKGSAERERERIYK